MDQNTSMIQSSLETDLHTYSQLILEKGAKAIQWRNGNHFSTRTTGHPHAKNKFRHRSYTFSKIIQNRS